MSSRPVPSSVVESFINESESAEDPGAVEDIIPVPQTPCPSGPQGYRPLALTSQIMKTLERLVFDQLDLLSGHIRIPFSSPFRTIRPTLLGDKPIAMQVDASFVSRIVNYLNE